MKINSPEDPNALFRQAFQLQQNGRMGDAELLFRKILKISPSYIGAKTMLGTICIQDNRNIEGIKLLESSLLRDPKQFWAHNSLGVGYLNTKQFQRAFSSFNKAIVHKPDYIDAYFNLAKVQRALGRFQDAVSSYTKCISIDPSHADAYINRGTIFLEDLHQYERSLSDYQQFIKLFPSSSYGFYNSANALKAIGKHSAALVDYDHAIELKPDYAEAYVNRGSSFYDLKQYDAALVDYDYAIELKPDYADAYVMRGAVFFVLKKYDAALIDYDRVIKLELGKDRILGDFLITKMFLCDWVNYQQLLNQLKNKILKNNKVSSPFQVLSLIDNPKIQKHSAESYIKEECPISDLLPKLEKRSKHAKIRIGYFSADFREHPVSYLTAELFESHNRDQFEVIAFSFGVDTQDNLRKRLEKGFDHFIDVQDKTDQEIAMLAREMEIDIAIDLGGFTQDSRTNIFAMRAAPIQLSYIGYLGTMGADYFDYLIADPILIPQDQQQYYSEKIVYLPYYQVNDNKREISDKVYSREELGLPLKGFVFCCFNDVYKISPSIFDSWMRIMGAVKGSVLFLLDANETATKNLIKEAEARGVNSDRLFFAKRLPLPEYLARYRMADLFLDTLPYNAGTTASDALRMGLPVLTQMGQSFASRMAASVLNAVGLPELITTTQEEYESLAISLAKIPVEIQKIKNKLAANLPASDLYNTQKFTRNIESAYRSMYQRYQNDLPTDHIYVDCI